MSTVTAVIDQLRLWHAGEWKAYNNYSRTKLVNVFIRIHYDQLFILSEDKVLESLNLNGKIKGIYKDNVLILVTCNSLQQVRKIKFQIKTNIAECFHKLRLHFPVVSYNTSSNLHEMKYRNIEDVLKKALNMKGIISRLQLPLNFKDFIQLCLLDPDFPNVVDATQDVLRKLDIK